MTRKDFPDETRPATSPANPTKPDPVAALRFAAELGRLIGRHMATRPRDPGPTARPPSDPLRPPLDDPKAP